MTNLKIYHPVLERQFDIRFFIYLFPVFLTLDLVYYAPYYILLVFVLFVFEKLSTGFSDFYLMDFIQWLFLLFWGIYQISVSFEKPEAAYYYYITVFIPFILFLIFTNIKFRLSQLDYLFNILFLSGIILAIYSFYVLYSINFDFRFRIPSIWVHYNLVAAYLMILFLFNVSFLVHTKFGLKFFYYTVSLIFILLGLLMTQTRGIWLATIIAITFYFIKKPKIIIPVLSVAVILILLFYEVIMDRFLSVVNFGNDTSSLGRLQAWMSTLILIKENFFWGYGFDAYRHLRDNVFTAYFVVLPHPHNTYLTLILEIGFIGFIVYISFFVKAFWYSIKLRRNSTDNELNKYYDALQISFAGLLVAFMFEPYFTVLGCITYVIWILIALSYYFRFNLIKN